MIILINGKKVNVPDSTRGRIKFDARGHEKICISMPMGANRVAALLSWVKLGRRLDAGSRGAGQVQRIATARLLEILDLLRSRAVYSDAPWGDLAYDVGTTLDRLDFDGAYKALIRVFPQYADEGFSYPTAPRKGWRRLLPTYRFFPAHPPAPAGHPQRSP